MDLRFHKNHAKWFVTPVLRAVRRYALNGEGDRVCVGLSGGKDSTTLLYILRYLQRHSHLEFELSAIHVRTSPDYETASLRDYCDAMAIPYIEAALELPSDLAAEKACSICARLKRGAAVQALAHRGIRKLAYGHHADDAAETLLMNIVQNKKLGSFSPKVVVEDSPVTIIRPMIYLNEDTVASVHRHAGLPLLNFTCPYAQHNIRQRYKETLRLCWDVVLMIRGRGEMFRELLDASTGEVLVRRCLNSYLTDVLTVAYSSHFFLPPLLMMLLYSRGRVAEFRDLVLAMVLTTPFDSGSRSGKRRPRGSEVRTP
jgi:tRNA 2-thiocytidine biosynthesis protein TtcA